MIAPELTVIIARQDPSASLVECIESLEGQAGVRPGVLEVIVVDALAPTTTEDITERFPAVRLIRPAGIRSLPMLLGTGMMAARGQLIATTEAHCTFAPGWIVTAIAAHSVSSSPVIGGAVEPGRGLTALDWALYFSDYGQFLLPLRARVTHDLPGNNVVFKREILGEVAQYAHSGFWKTFFCHALEQSGHRLLVEPRLVVYYGRHIGVLDWMRRRYRHGRCFGGMRARQSTGLRRSIYALAAPGMPLLLLYRLLRRVWAKGRYRRTFLRVLPVSFGTLLLWAVGEAIGNLFGTGNSCRYL